MPSTPVCTGAGTANAETNLSTTNTYDAVGHLLSVTAPDPAAGTGSTATIVTYMAYDGAGRLCRVLENGSTDLQSLADPCTTSVSGTTSTNLSTRYAYDKAGNIVTATDAAAQTQSYGYDRLGRMTSRTDGAGTTEEWQYDQRGNRTALVSRTSTPSTSVTWAYDNADRNTSRTADSATTTYTYDANGNMLTAASATGTITATYDRLDRVKTVDPDDTARDTVYTYGSNSGERDDPSGVGYFFNLDKWARQTNVDAPYASGNGMTWRADGLPLRSTDANGNTTEHSYDAAGHLTEIKTWQTSTPATVRADIVYTTNRAGMRRSEASTITGDPANGTASFAYDSLGRLANYDSPLGSTSDRDYAWARVLDRTGVTTDPSGSPSTVTTTFNAADRPTSDTAGGSYTHDANGRMTARPGQKLEWDSLGRLTKVRDGTTNAVISAYTYDALDRLREITTGSAVTRMRYVGLSTAVGSTYNVVTSASIKYYANDWTGRLFADFSSTAGAQRSYGRNGHGDITWLSDNVGAVTRTLRYDPDGNLVASSGTSLPPFRFQGSWRDSATELYWVVTRWYAPAQARFVSEDSLLGEPSNPDSRHLYAYALGDPVDGWDPDGRASARTSYARFSNPRRVHGRFVLVLFIARSSIDPHAWGWLPTRSRIDGDNRGFASGPLCGKKQARACIDVNFNSNTVTTIVNPSCGSLPVLGETCRTAWAINDWKGWNRVTVSGGRAKVKIKWHLSQSLVPQCSICIDAIPSIDGNLTLRMPGSKSSGWWELSNDGFPSVEMFYTDGSSHSGNSWSAQYRRREGSPNALEGGPDWRISLPWPRQRGRTGGQ